jgi:hypothetical protein
MQPALTPELKAEVCRRIADGETVRQIAASENMPAKSTIFAELRRDTEFARQYAVAREQQLMCWEDDLIAVADDSTGDTIERDDGSTVTDHENVARSKLRIWTRQWVMSKRLPRVYGDRISQEVSGPGGGPVEVKELSMFETARRLAFILEQGAREIEKGKSE